MAIAIDATTTTAAMAIRSVISTTTTTMAFSGLGGGAGTTAPPPNGGGEFVDDFDYYFDAQSSSPPSGASLSSTPPAPPSSTFFSRKSISDAVSSSPPGGVVVGVAGVGGGGDFERLCSAAGVSRPSRIQSLAWPHLLRGESCVVADQTGSGKTLAYLLPLLAGMMMRGGDGGGGGGGNGRPRAVILAPTAELADQIYSVCASLSESLKAAAPRSSSSSPSSPPRPWTFRPFVTTSAGSRVTNIRDQIRLLRSTPVDVLISTPGRLATILRTRNSGLDLGDVATLVLDEVDFLLVDETFGPQLRAVGAAVKRGGGEGGDGAEDAGDGAAAAAETQFVFVTATLPTDVLDAIRAEVPGFTELRGPGLHRITPAVQQTLIDVPVPATMNRDQNACFDLKVRELLKALRGRRCDRTLVICNTVETCRDVENALKRNDRGGGGAGYWRTTTPSVPRIGLRTSTPSPRARRWRST